MVYFIQAESGGPIKIGYTKGKSAKGRLSSFQTAHAQKLVLLATSNVHREKELHERFASLRLHGEWFRASIALVQWIQLNTVVTADGHRQLAKTCNWTDGRDD